MKIVFLSTFYWCLYYTASTQCIVTLPDLKGVYEGDCKNGLANGNGIARGKHYYNGNFKDGKPEGEGSLYYNDTVLHNGSFYDGVEEGKGERIYKKRNGTDSIIKGFWSGGVYRGKTYSTYYSNISKRYDQVTIEPSKQKGTKLKIEILTTSGNPNGIPMDLQGNSGYVLNLTNLLSTNNDLIIFRSTLTTTMKSHYEFDLHTFPAYLQLTLNDGEVFTLDLFKKANWRVQIYYNR